MPPRWPLLLDPRERGSLFSPTSARRHHPLHQRQQPFPSVRPNRPHRLNRSYQAPLNPALRAELARLAHLYTSRDRNIRETQRPVAGHKNAHTPTRNGTSRPERGQQQRGASQSPERAQRESKLRRRQCRHSGNGKQVRNNQEKHHGNHKAEPVDGKKNGHLHAPPSRSRSPSASPRRHSLIGTLTASFAAATLTQKGDEQGLRYSSDVGKGVDEVVTRQVHNGAVLDAELDADFASNLSGSLSDEHEYRTAAGSVIDTQISRESAMRAGVHEETKTQALGGIAGLIQRYNTNPELALQPSRGDKIPTSFGAPQFARRNTESRSNASRQAEPLALALSGDGNPSTLHRQLQRPDPATTNNTLAGCAVQQREELDAEIADKKTKTSPNQRKHQEQRQEQGQEECMQRNRLPAVVLLQSKLNKLTIDESSEGTEHETTSKFLPTSSVTTPDTSPDRECRPPRAPTPPRGSTVAGSLGRRVLTPPPSALMNCARKRGGSGGGGGSIRAKRDRQREARRGNANGGGNGIGPGSGPGMRGGHRGKNSHPESGGGGGGTGTWVLGRRVEKAFRQVGR